jgi:hypothetical protein
MDIISFITPQIAVLGLVALVLSGGGEAGRLDTVAGKIRNDLPRFQSALANSSADKRSGSDQRDCGSLGSAGQLEMGGLVSNSSGLRTGHWSVHTDSCRANNAA